MNAAKASTSLRTGLRIAGAVFGGYVVTALAVTTAAALLARLGMARSEAVALAAMTGFIVYLALLLWAFSVHSVARLWAVLALAMAAMGAVLYLLA